jgi:hypothetical protein
MLTGCTDKVLIEEICEEWLREVTEKLLKNTGNTINIIKEIPLF